MALDRELEQYHTNEFTITASAPMAGPNCSYRPMTQHSRRSSATQSTDLFGVATQSASKRIESQGQAGRFFARRCYHPGASLNGEPRAGAEVSVHAAGGDDGVERGPLRAGLSELTPRFFRPKEGRSFGPCSAPWRSAASSSQGDCSARPGCPGLCRPQWLRQLGLNPQLPRQTMSAEEIRDLAQRLFKDGPLRPLHQAFC